MVGTFGYYMVLYEVPCDFDLSSDGHSYTIYSLIQPTVCHNISDFNLSFSAHFYAISSLESTNSIPQYSCVTYLLIETMTKKLTKYALSELKGN